jgi:mannose-6-phosphate isomerase
LLWPGAIRFVSHRIGNARPSERPVDPRNIRIELSNVSQASNSTSASKFRESSVALTTPASSNHWRALGEGSATATTIGRTGCQTSIGQRPRPISPYYAHQAPPIASASLGAEHKSNDSRSHRGVLKLSNIGPLFLPSNQFDHFYRGGDRIGALRDGPGGPMRPEEWIGSTVTRFGESEQGLSRLPDGTLLKDAILADPISWLGRDHYEAYGESTEILVKLLDPDQRLPVHFHPNKSFARKHLSLQHGKTEAWIVLEAPPGARVGLGFAEEKTKDEVLHLVDTHDSAGLLASLNWLEVNAGDAIVVPSGTPHAIDAGIFVLELQEPTDLSILLEWDGFAVDGDKDGHLGLGFDTAIDALNLLPLTAEERARLIASTGLDGAEAASLFTSAADGYFHADLMPGNGSSLPQGFSLLLVLDGEGTLCTQNSGTIAISRGDALVMPFSSGGYTVRGARVISCRPPKPVDAAKAP